MKRTIHVIKIKSAQELLNIDEIINISHHQRIKLIFENSALHLREDYGQYLKGILLDFLIGVHEVKPEINISPLILEKEILDNQSFFIQCAKDYRKLGSELVPLFFQKKKLKLNEKFPFINFNQLKCKNHQSGKVGDWKYFIHGHHCHFKNKKTDQEIEVPFMFGMEFGDLDPYFFVKFIKSTPEYQPLPVFLDEDFHDGQRILKTMLDLGLLEKINSSIEWHSGLVIKDREKIEIERYDPDRDFKELKQTTRLSKLFQFFKF